MVTAVLVAYAENVSKEEKIMRKVQDDTKT